MEKLKLVKPNKYFEQEAKEYIKEFRDFKSHINGVGELDGYDNYDDWLKKIENELDDSKIKPGRVKASTYFLIKEGEDKIIGMINIRHELNDYLLNFGGHVGYSIRPTERRKGYATELLALGLKECIKLGIKKVLLTCDKENMGSSKTIINNGGILENEVQDEDRIT